MITKGSPGCGKGITVHKILVCDDDKDIVKAISIYLKAEGYDVAEAYNGKEAVEILEKENKELLILDVMMPEMDGISALSAIREKSNIPVIMLTAKSEDTDKVIGLNIGADDYVTKPFNPVELIARVNSQLRRYTRLGGVGRDENETGMLTVGGIELNDASKEVRVDGQTVHLTKTEYDILKFFMQHPNTVYSPNEIYERIWNDAAFGNEGTVAVHIRHLREKIEIDPSEPRYIKMIWGRGYILPYEK